MLLRLTLLRRRRLRHGLVSLTEWHLRCEDSKVVLVSILFMFFNDTSLSTILLANPNGLHNRLLAASHQRF